MERKGTKFKLSFKNAQEGETKRGGLLPLCKIQGRGPWRNCLDYREGLRREERSKWFI